MLLKYKEQASGYPANVESEQEKDAYISEFERVEGIKLEKEKIKRNEGYRAISKLLLNSFWGKFAQQSNKTQTKWVDNYKDWLDLISHDKYKITNVNTKVNGVFVVSYTVNDPHFEVTNNNVNVVLAAFVTCQARLKLFKEMKKLGDRVNYHDTDSLIFSKKPGEYEPETGNNLGELTDECPKGDWIKELVCPGPKNYAYKLNSDTAQKPNQKVVIKGFNMTFLALKSLGFDQIKKTLLEKDKSEIFVDQLKFVRKDEKITTKLLKKKYGIEYDKRKILNDGSWRTLPWGYKEIWRPF